MVVQISGLKFLLFETAGHKQHLGGLFNRSMILTFEKLTQKISVEPWGCRRLRPGPKRWIACEARRKPANPSTSVARSLQASDAFSIFQGPIQKERNWTKDAVGSHENTLQAFLESFHKKNKQGGQEFQVVGYCKPFEKKLLHSLPANRRRAQTTFQAKPQRGPRQFFPIFPRTYTAGP